MIHIVSVNLEALAFSLFYRTLLFLKAAVLKSSPGVLPPCFLFLETPTCWRQSCLPPLFVKKHPLPFEACDRERAAEDVGKLGTRSCCCCCSVSMHRTSVEGENEGNGSRCKSGRFLMRRGQGGLEELNKQLDGQRLIAGKAVSQMGN